MAFFGDGLYGLKVATRFTPTALDGGNEHAVGAQKTEAHVEQRSAVAVFERECPKALMETDAVELEVDRAISLFAELDSMTLNQLLGDCRSKLALSHLQVGGALRKALFLRPAAVQIEPERDIKTALMQNKKRTPKPVARQIA